MWPLCVVPDVFYYGERIKEKRTYVFSRHICISNKFQIDYHRSREDECKVLDATDYVGTHN